jgi:psp operon transcriptional activator
MQEKILRVIEYGELTRVGGSRTTQVDVRIVGSTNADLESLAAEGRFREDLLDRLAFDVITVPPLRERPDDILPLAYAFAVNMASELKRRVFPGFSPRAASALLRHEWPGNVRELKNAVERSVYRSPDESEQIGKIAFDPFESPYRMREERKAGASPQPALAPRQAVLPTDFNERINETERELLRVGLEKARFNQRRAADLLGLTYHQLRGKLRKHGFDARAR